MDAGKLVSAAATSPAPPGAVRRPRRAFPRPWTPSPCRAHAEGAWNVAPPYSSSHDLAVRPPSPGAHVPEACLRSAGRQPACGTPIRGPSPRLDAQNPPPSTTPPRRRSSLAGSRTPPPQAALLSYEARRPLPAFTRELLHPPVRAAAAVRRRRPPPAASPPNPTPQTESLVTLDPPPVLSRPRTPASSPNSGEPHRCPRPREYIAKPRIFPRASLQKVNSNSEVNSLFIVNCVENRRKIRKIQNQFFLDSW
jgi:hypothetical protein